MAIATNSLCAAVALALMALAPGCGSTVATSATPVDATPDSRPDATLDSALDAAADAPLDSALDAAADAPPDSRLDAQRDAAADTAPDAASDTTIAPDAQCARVVTSSTLPGVRFDLSGNRCRYTLAEVAAGVSFVYRTVVDAPLAGVQQERSATRCDPADPSGLLVNLSISGASQGFCWCDCGLGPGGTATIALAAGSYPNALDWDGTSWQGPSDTGMPHGPHLPPGTYSFVARASGTAPAPGGSAPFTIVGTLTFDLE